MSSIKVPLLTQVDVDEKYLGRRNKREEKSVTIVSNLATGEPIWIGNEPAMQRLGLLRRLA